MADVERDAGKRWVIRAVTELARAADAAVDTEWGPSWADAPSSDRRRKPKPATTAMLVLTAGPVRRVLWLAEEELVAAGIEDASSRERLRKRMGAAIESLRSTPKRRKPLAPPR